jgi:acyl dehydratase
MPGLYFDELTVGQTFRHPLSRTVTEADNVFFSALTHNPALLHLDEEYCREHTEFGQRLVNSAFTLGLMVGISVGDTTLGTARIVAGLRDGALASLSRTDVGMVVTEHGAADLRGLSVHGRAAALIGTAAPAFREALRGEWKTMAARM